MARLEGKTALVTGAGGAIAGASARAFAAEGASVLVCDLDEAAAGATARAIAGDGGTAEARQCDVADPASAAAAVEACIAAYGRIDILMNAAAAREQHGNVVELDLAEWNRAMAVNLTGIFLMCKHAIPYMAAGGGGSIVNVASQLGSVATPNRPAYVTSKAAVIQLSRSMALDFAKNGIRVNALSPGAVETARLTSTGRTMDEVREALVPMHPIGRLGQPDEIADAALFLACSDSRFMTGADLVVDGGYSAV